MVYLVYLLPLIAFHANLKGKMKNMFGRLCHVSDE